MTSISNKVYKLDDIINEYNNTYHFKVKVKPADINSSLHIGFNVENLIKTVNLKLVAM